GGATRATSSCRPIVIESERRKERLAGKNWSWCSRISTRPRSWSARGSRRQVFGTVSKGSRTIVVPYIRSLERGIGRDRAASSRLLHDGGCAGGSLGGHGLLHGSGSALALSLWFPAASVKGSRQHLTMAC